MLTEAEAEDALAYAAISEKHAKAIMDRIIDKLSEKLSQQAKERADRSR